MTPPVIHIDADACPVKAETYKVAQRLSLKVRVVANAWLNVPQDPRIELVTVSDGFDAADDRIVADVTPGDVVITADIQLAARCLDAGAAVIAPDGREFSRANIGQALAMRALMADLRAGADQGGLKGPKPMTPRDRSNFLQTLDRVITRLMRG
ncbi:YaiI/YqxD family protein (plasmid) [Tistrella mobilis]|uniref:YaiI/YqxD family protein n=1 Tax=Tistrella mobilis TaxID=171437 RepID=UPI003558CDAB